MNFVKFLYFIIIALYAIWLFCGGLLTTAGASPHENKDLVVLLNTDGSLPYEEDQPGDVLATFSDNVFGSWIRMTTLGKYSSEVVDFNFSDDNRSLDLTIKPGIQFHDGSVITAEDFQFSLLRGLFTDKASFYAGFLGCIEGVDGSTTLKPGSSLAGVQIQSRFHVRLKFIRPCREILHALTLPYVAPRPKGRMTDDFVHFKGLPVGVGPYRVTSEDRSSGEILLERMHPRTGYPRRISMRTRDSGSIPDIALSRASDAYNTELINTYLTSPSATLTLFSSQRNAIFTSSRTRELFYKIFDRRILTANSSESAAYSLSLYGGVKTLNNLSIDEARQELRIILSKLPQASRTLIVALFGSIDARKAKLIRDLTKQFNEVGLGVEFEVVPQKFLSAEDGKKYAFWLAGLVIDPVAPGAMLSSFRESSAFPFHSVPSSRLTKLFVNWENAVTTNEKTASAVALDDFIAEGGYGIPLLRDHNAIFYNPLTIENLGQQNQILSIDISEVRSKTCANALRY
jgi:hypothetical protein